MALTAKTVPKGMKIDPEAWKRHLDRQFEVLSNVRKLREGDVIKYLDGTYHFIQYVNSSGAYAVPLSSITHEIKGHAVSFTGGGRTISAGSICEIVNPLLMGGNSPEYRRYVKMSQSLREGTPMFDVDGKPGVGLGDFDPDTYHDPGSDLDEADGHSVLTDAEIDARYGDGSMAKKAKSAKGKSGAAKREKTPAKVRDCVCGCGTETTGYFAPGHDARYHGWVKKLADGRIQRNGKDAKSGEQVVGASVLNKMGLVAKGDGFKATTPEFYKD